MFRFSTIRRRVLLGAGYLLVLSGLSLAVVHTSLVRRFALVQVQVRLGNALGLVINAKELDYNLFTSRFELKDVAVQGVRLTQMPIPVKAQRIELVVPVWRLIRGSFETARIRVDGLSVHRITNRAGQDNWPTLPAFGGGGNGGGPSVRVTSGELGVQDDRSSFLLRLPIQQLSAGWDQASSRYGIQYESTGGLLVWKDQQLPLDRLQLKSAIGGGGVSVESLRLGFGGSEVELSGGLSGSPARLEAAGDVNLDLRDISRALVLTDPARGRLQAHLSASGLLDALQIKAAVRGEDLVAAALPIRRPVVDASIDLGTGEVRIEGVSAGIFGGRLTAKGRLWTGANPGRSELTASLKGLDSAQAAGFLGGSLALPGPTALDVTASFPVWNGEAPGSPARRSRARPGWYSWRPAAPNLFAGR